MAVENKIGLTTAQLFELERFNRAIDECDSKELLREVAKDCLRGFFTQKAALSWLMKDLLDLKEGA